MNKLNKPKLEFHLSDLFGTAFTIVSPLITWIYTKWYYAIILLLLILLIILICKIVLYSKSVNEFYDNHKEIEARFNTLENRYNLRTREINNKDNIIREYENFIRDLDIFITTALTQNSPNETKQLENMKKLLYISIEHLANMKGEL